MRRTLIIALALAPLTSAAFAAAVTSADITVFNLTISADQSFVLLSDGGQVVAQAGPDSQGHLSTQALPIAGPTTVDAAIATAIAHGDSSISAINSGAVTSIILPGRINAASSVAIAGGASQSTGIAAPVFQFEAPGASTTNPIHLTFSMTIYGAIGGTDDGLSSYSSFALAQFGYFTNYAPHTFIPVDDFSVSLSGGASNPLRILDPVTFSQTVSLDSSADYFFQALAEARSEAQAAVPEPSSIALFAGALLAARRRRTSRRPVISSPPVTPAAASVPLRR